MNVIWHAVQLGAPYAFDNLEYEGNMMYECKIMILV